jgi:hypothetical protein
MCVPVIAAMYLRTSWAVSVGVLCGYLLRSAWLIFGEPFRVSA